MTSKQYFCVGELLNYQKILWMHSNGDCTTVRYHRKIYESWQKNCVFRFSLGLFTQIMDFKYKQAYKMIETGVLVWKSKNLKSYQAIFFCFGSKMVKTKWWIHVSYDFSYTECQLRLGLYAGSCAKILHFRNIPSLNTLVGSVRYLITMLKNSLFLYNVELYPTFLHCWTIPNPNILLRYTIS